MNKEERLAKDHAIDPILFYRPQDPFGWASNFSSHCVWLPHPQAKLSTRYATTEHRYQAMKCINREDHDYVNAASSPSRAKDRGREISLREGWGNKYGDLCWYVMIECLQAKIRTHTEISTALFATKNRTLYEDSPIDDIWGWRFHSSYTGKNLLGQAWMYVRFHQLHTYMNLQKSA